MRIFSGRTKYSITSANRALRFLARSLALLACALGCEVAEALRVLARPRRASFGVETMAVAVGHNPAVVWYGVVWYGRVWFGMVW